MAHPHQPLQHVPRRALHRPPQDRQAARCACAAEAAQGADLLHRRHQRAARARSTRRSSARAAWAATSTSARPRRTTAATSSTSTWARSRTTRTLDTPERRDELARITNGYSPAMIDQVCSMALTYAHSDGREVFDREDIVEAMTTVESGTASASPTPRTRSARSRSTRPATRSASHLYTRTCSPRGCRSACAAPRRPPPGDRDRGALRRLALRGGRRPDLDARRDGRRARLLRREHDRRRRRHRRPRDAAARWSA